MRRSRESAPDGLVVLSGTVHNSPIRTITPCARTLYFRGSDAESGIFRTGALFPLSAKR